MVNNCTKKIVDCGGSIALVGTRNDIVKRLRRIKRTKMIRRIKKRIKNLSQIRMTKRKHYLTENKLLITILNKSTFYKTGSTERKK